MGTSNHISQHSSRTTVFLSMLVRVIDKKIYKKTKFIRENKLKTNFVTNFGKEQNSLKTYQGPSKQQEVEEMRFSEAEIEEQERKEETGGVVK